MKILVVCQYYYPEPFRISDICESLVKKGHAVTVLTGLPNYPEGRVLDDYRNGKKRNEVIKGVNVIRCFEIGRGNSHIRLFFNYISFAVSATIKAIFMKEEYDAIFVNQLSPVIMGIPAIAYKKKHHKRILLYCLDLWPDSLASGGIKEGSIIYKLVYKISRWVYSSSDMILVTSSTFQDYFRNTLRINNIDIKYLPQYAEDLFNQLSEETAAQIAASSENKVHNFVFTGNIGSIQSVETIIRAANELRNYSDITFHIIGEGSKLDECKQLANALQLINVKFYGRRPVDEMPQFYKSADAMLITMKNNKTLSYTLPGKVQTYMAAGKSIIGSINGETRRVIEQADCGFCCDAENYKGLAGLIIKFLNSDKKEMMGANAQKFYLDNYSKEKFMSSLDDILIKLEA